MLVQRLRRYANIDPALRQRLLFCWVISIFSVYSYSDHAEIGSFAL